MTNYDRLKGKVARLREERAKHHPLSEAYMRTEMQLFRVMMEQAST